MLTRLVDWLNVPPGALVKPKDPREYLWQSALSPEGAERRRLRFSAVTDQVVIWTDGGCKGNPGPGGWGAILKYSEQARRSFRAASPHTTNNRMELTAAIFALEALKRPCRVVPHTDSQYLRNGIIQLDSNMEAQRLAHRRHGARSRTRTFGAASTKPESATRSNGDGSKAMPATR